MEWKAPFLASLFLFLPWQVNIETLSFFIARNFIEDFVGIKDFRPFLFFCVFFCRFFYYLCGLRKGWIFFISFLLGTGEKDCRLHFHFMSDFHDSHYRREIWRKSNKRKIASIALLFHYHPSINKFPAKKNEKSGKKVFF